MSIPKPRVSFNIGIYGQFGIPNFYNESVSTPVHSTGGGVVFHEASITAAASTTCHIGTIGVQCWGYGINGYHNEI